MLRSIILGVLCFAATTFAADVCTLQCVGTSGKNWTGDTSVVVKVGGSTEIIYEVDLKIFAVVNTQDNLVIGIKGQFLVVVNIKTGGYILIDLQTQFAVYGKITVEFLSSSGSIDYVKLTAQLNILLTKYERITVSTSYSFNFSLLIVSYYRYQFDLTVIFAGQTELIAFLNANFTVWFQLIRTQITSGAISVSRGIWGLICVIIRVEINVSIAIFEVIASSIVAFGRIEVKLIVEIVRIISTDIRGIIAFSLKIVDAISTGIATSIDGLVKWIHDASANPVALNVTIAGTTLTVIVTRIEQVYILRFTLKVQNRANVDIKITSVGNVLFVTNEATKITVAFYQRAFVLINSTCDQVIVFKTALLSINSAIVTDAKLVAHIRYQRYSKAAEEVRKLVKDTKVTINSGKLQHAVLSGSVKEIAAIVGSANAQVILVYFRVFFEGSNGGSLGGYAIGVFGLRGNLVVRAIGSVFDVIAAAGGAWSTFIKFFAGGKITIHTG